jgi:phage-related tail protein
MDQATYASSYEQKLAQAKLAAQLSDLKGVAQEQKTTAELQLEVATQQINDLNAQAASTNAFYEAQLFAAQAQINELRNVNGSVLSVADAMASLGAAINAAKNQGGGGGGGGGGGASSNGLESQVNALYQEILGRNAEAAGLADWTTRGISIEEIRAGIMGSDEARARGFATGGYYPGGLAMVGERGPELINFNRPGQVYTAGQTAEIMSGGSLAAEIQGLRADIRAQSRSNAQIQIRTAKVLERWEYSGLPDTRVEV